MSGAEKKVQQLRALIALPEDPRSPSSTHMPAQPSVTPVPGNLLPSSGFSEYQSCTWNTYIEEQNTYTHKIKAIILF